MKEQMSVAELIQTVSQSMKGDGIKQDYITQLSYTWKALEQYLIAQDLVFSKENAFAFLKDKYDIHADQNFAKLRPIDKRRKRAVCALLYCADGKSVYREKTYWPCSFHDAYVLPFYEFLNERKSQDLALSTINRDIYTLNHFSKYLQESRISKISDISPAIVQGFMKWLAEQKNLPTLKSVSASMRVLLRYLYQNGHTPEDYSPVVLSVRCRKVVPSVYQTDDIEKMLVSFNQSSAVGIRNYAMVLMAARLGIRASDICALEFKNIHWERNTIEFVTVKTGKPAVLPLPADVGNAIIRYIKDVRPSSEDHHIFLRMQAPFKKLNPASLHMIVTNAFRDAGITARPGRCHGPHALRASLATSMLEKEIPLPVISEVLSHSDTDTTKMYLKVDMHHLRKIALEVPGLTGVWMGGVRI